MICEIQQDRILILDFGSQYTQLIARRVREAGVYCEIYAYDQDPQKIQLFNPRGLILSGGPQSVHEMSAPCAPEQIFKLGIPILGICYGLQTLAAQLGGTVSSARQREYGYARVRLHGNSLLLKNIYDSNDLNNKSILDVWMSHGDRVEKLPPGFKIIAETEHAPYAGIADESRNFYGLQFHPEVTHTRQGQKIIERFVYEICGCRKLWTPERIIIDKIAQIRHQVGTERVLLALSGGVDSSVVAALLQRAIGEQLICVFVDHGLLRLGESEQVMKTFSQQLGINLLKINAAQRFLNNLTGIADPEAKRKIIGATFISVFEEEAQKIDNIKWLAQGTIYPDVIESAGAHTGKARVIKSHHNVGGLPEKMHLKLLEPLRELFKDEVRQIGKELGLPAEIIQRHPFPGPGLGVRMLGEIRVAELEILRQADAIFLDELHHAGLYDQIAQAFAVFLPVNSVGVIGDNRQYAPVIALRAVETSDFMTARWAHLPHDLLDRISRRIINEIPGVSRVVYDITGKPPGTIEWE